MLIYYNPNPTGKSNKTDCVIRALTKALNESWTTVYWELCKLGYELGVWGDRMPVWSKYLRQHGFRRHVIPDFCPDCYTVEDFSNEHNHGAYVLATDTHVVAVIDGDIYDAWDSRKEVPAYYFAKES